MSYLLGIDVGTTRTAAAVGRTGPRPGECEIVNLGDRSSAVPSVLHIADDGTMLVGDGAQRRAIIEPGRVAREFKRRIGDPTPVMVAGTPWAPEELSARLVRWVVDRAAQREGGPAARIAVTHPASWGAHKKERLGGALAGQGLAVTFLAEPQAAALHYASAERVEPGSTIAVYDLGGGTFDAAVVHKDGSGFGLLGRPEGLERLGGVDFDEAVFEHVRQGLPDAFEGLDDTDPDALSAVAAVRRECTEAKEALSTDTEVSIPVLTPAGRGAVRLHRSEFEAMIRRRVQETVEALRRAIGSAGLEPDGLSAVLLVGGSSRIPLVGQLVSEQLGRPVAVDTDPKNAIAMGAALSLRPPAAPNGGPRPVAAPGSLSGPPMRPAGPMTGAAALGMAAGGAGAGFAGTGTTGPGSGGSGARPGPGGPPVRPPAEPPTRPVPADPFPRPVPDEARGPVPPWRGPAVADAGDDAGYAEPRPARSPALLVGLGGAAAAMAVLAAVLLLPNGGPIPQDRRLGVSDSPAGVVTPAATAPQETTTAAPTPTADPGDPVREPEPAAPPAPAPVTTAVPVTAVPTVVPTTVPPVPTTTAPPPVTTTPSVPAEEPPPVEQPAAVEPAAPAG